MKIAILAGIVTIAACLSFPAASADRQDGTDALLQSNAVNLEKDREVDFVLAPVKSERDMRSYLIKKSAASPLNHLSPGAQKRFTDSVRFNERGVTTYDYADLRSELTASEVYKILSLFGVQRTTSIIPGLRIITEADRAIMAPQGAVPSLYPDYPDHACEGRATCGESLTKICTSNC